MIAVAFDFDHTLALDHALERTAFYLLAEELGEPAPRDDVSLQAQIDTLLADFRAGTIPLSAAVQRFVASLHGVHTTERDDTVRFQELCYELVDRHVEPLPGASALLEHLQRTGIPTAILTNGWSPLQQKKIAVLGYGGPILVSDEIRALKPNVRAFNRLVETLGVPREDVWYVGDSPAADVAGALAAGLNAVWLDRSEIAYPPGQDPPTLRVTDLAELIERFPGPVTALEKRP